MRISISTNNSIELFELSDILYLSSEGNYTNVHLLNGKRVIANKNLSRFALSLPSKMFVRIHNSYLVNINKIVRFDKGDGSVALIGGERLPVARDRKMNVLRSLESDVEQKQVGANLNDYLISDEFNNKMHSMNDVFRELQDNLSKERIAMPKIWDTREKLILAIQQNDELKQQMQDNLQIERVAIKRVWSQRESLIESAAMKFAMFYGTIKGLASLDLNDQQIGITKKKRTKSGPFHTQILG